MLTEIPGPLPMSAERLRDAIAGLAGIAGFLVLPTLSAWFRLLIRVLESDSASIGPRRRFSTLALVRALGLTAGLAFVLFSLQRAVSELRELQMESSIAGLALTGTFVGLVFWMVYATSLRLLRTDYERLRLGRRLGGRLS